MKKIFLTVIASMFLSCMVQFSTVHKIKTVDVCDANTAMLAISAVYEMNMGISHDVKFYLKECSTGTIVGPQKRDKKGNNLYLSIPPGTYRIAMITIKDLAISKSIIFDDSSKKIIKMFGQVEANQLTNPIRTGNKFLFSGVLLTGDKKLVYYDDYSEAFTITPNCGYHLGEYILEGYIEGIFNDMPNIRISRFPVVSADKLDSFKSIFSKSYPNSTGTIHTTTKLFNANIIDLAKSNAIKKENEKRR